MGFHKQEYWRGLPFPSPGDLPKGSTPHLLYCLWVLYCWVTREPPTTVLIILTMSYTTSLLLIYFIIGPVSPTPSPTSAAAESLQSCPTLRPHRRQPARFLRPWGSPGKNTGVGCLPPLVNTNLISISMRLFVHCLWSIITLQRNVMLVHVTQHSDWKFLYVSKWSSQCVVAICHHTQMLYNYWLCSPHYNFHTHDSFILQLKIWAS